MRNQKETFFYRNFITLVINLKKQNIKKRKMLQVLSKFSFKYKFIEAYDASKNDEINIKGYKDLKRRLYLGRSLLDKEHAIFESHKKAINIFLKTNLKWCLILEDDIKIPKKLEKVLIDICSMNYDWDVIRFINKPKFKLLKGYKVIDINDEFFLKRLPKLPGGAYGYIITKLGAKKIISMTKSYYHPFDILLGQCWKKNLNALFCIPGLIEHPPVPKKIEKNDPRYFRPVKSPLTLHFYFRFIFKLNESVMKWVYYYYRYFLDFIILKIRS